MSYSPLCPLFLQVTSSTVSHSNTMVMSQPLSRPRLCYVHPFTPLVNNSPFFLIVIFPPVFWTFYNVEMVQHWSTVARLQSLKRRLLKLLRDTYVEMTWWRRQHFETLCSEVGQLWTDLTLSTDAHRWWIIGLVQSWFPQGDSWQHISYPRSLWDRNVTHHLLLLCY